MSVILAFLVGVIAVSGWWLVRHGLMTKPWLETGASPAMAPSMEPPSGRIGLTVLLSVIGAVFALFGSAFVMRMDLAEWSTFSLPPIVWTNTAQLALASLFLHLAVTAARRDETAAVRLNLGVATLATLGFLVGQLLAWRALVASGNGLAAGPAASFFYLLSGLHGLHILGGLVALGMATRRGDLARGLRLCTTYWHFLAVVWVGLLVLFLGWANRLVDICRAVLT